MGFARIIQENTDYVIEKLLNLKMDSEGESSLKRPADEDLVKESALDISAMQPLDLSKASSSNEPSIPRSANFLNAAQNTSFKHIPTPSVEILPEIPRTDIFKPESSTVPEDLSLTRSDNDSNSSSDSQTLAVELASPDLAIEESNSRVSVSFWVKKSKRFCGAIRFYLSKPASTNSTKLRSLMRNLTDSVKSTLAHSVPSSKTIGQITSSLVNTLKGKNLPNCLRFLGFSMTSFGKRKKMKCIDSSQAGNGTFLNPTKKPELEHMAGFTFARPKCFLCSFCDSRFYKLPMFIKHIRRHSDYHRIIRCESCDKAFSSVINKRKHQLQCLKRAIL